MKGFLNSPTYARIASLIGHILILVGVITNNTERLVFGSFLALYHKES